MDFDRCSGEFSNPKTLFNEASTDPAHNPLSGIVSVEFSPNSRFVYATASSSLNQFDLLSQNIQDSLQIYLGDSTDQYELAYLQLAPNGKIYSSTYNGGLKALHAINNPDLKGDSAGFAYGGQPTKTLNSVNVPNLINYKLGPLIGSSCDTISTDNQTLGLNNSLRVIPNPADKYAYVEIGAQGDYRFELLNDAGQLIATKQTRQVDIFDTEHLANGVYFVRVVDTDRNVEVAGRKVVVVH